MVIKVLQEGSFTNRDGIQLHYMEQTSYDTDLKPILIIPALPEAEMDYKDIIFVLQNHTICFTPRGRELSDAPESGYSVQDHANDIIDAVNHFKLEELIIIAYSRGVAYFLQAFPEIKDKILGIVLMEYPAQYEAHPQDWAKKFLAISWRSMPVKERFPKPWVLEKIEQEATAVDLWETLKEIKCPIRLFVGHADFGDPALVSTKMTDEFVEKYKSYLPQLEVVDFEESGHDLRIWEYEKFVAEIRRFITDVTPKTKQMIEVEKKREKEERKRLQNEQKKKSEKKSLFGYNKEKLIKLN